MTNNENIFIELEQLSLKPLQYYKDLELPTKSSPHRQISHLFASVFRLKHSKSRKADIKSTYRYVLDMFKEKYGEQPLYIQDIFNEYILNDFHDHLKDAISKELLHNKFANVLQTTFKSILNKAIEINTPKFRRFYLPSSFCYHTRITYRYKPYNKNEKEKINEAIQKDIDRISLLTLPYQKSGKGRVIVDNHDRLLKGLGKLTLNDARWLFENRMDCNPICKAEEFQKNKISALFYRIILLNNKHYADVYESWGALCKVTLNHLIPYILKLLQITGMNVESIYSLNIDDLEESHPATGKPCLRYWKERSNGEKLYHLDIFNANLQWLTSSQGEQVKTIFDIVLKLTSYLRENAAPEEKNRLWLFEIRDGSIKSLPNNYLVHRAIKSFSNRHQLFKLDNNEKVLETTRFRPTFVSELVDKGVSIREIQLLMGHSNLHSTMRYLDTQDFSKSARTKLEQKLNSIHQNSLSSIQSTKFKKSKLNKHNNQIISTPLASCKNIFDPPEPVKNLPNYVEGNPCSTYNMCLTCSNIVLTRTDLPKLFAMRRDYLAKIQNSRILDTPFGAVIKSNLELLEAILNPEKSDFSSKELEDAESLSLYIETVELL